MKTTAPQLTQTMAVYKETIQGLDNLDLTNVKPTKKSITRLIRLVERIPDARLANKITYPLSEIIIIAFIATLAGFEGWTEMALYGEENISWLKKFLPLKNGIPSSDTFKRVFSLINPKMLELTTVKFLTDYMDRIQHTLEETNQEDPKSISLICVDGKEERGTGRYSGTEKKIPNIQTLHILDASNEICLYSELIEKKTNEIPTAQRILQSIQLRNTIVTFDAMNTQKKTIACIVEGKGDYIGALKGNHSTMHTEIKEYFTDKKKAEIKKRGTKFHQTIEKAHSQVETRSYYLTNSIGWFEDLEDWAKLKGFLCYEKEIYNTITGKTSIECRYYIVSLTDVHICAQALRGHWAVENKLHWHLDVSMNQDAQTTMDRNAFANLSLMNKMALSFLKLAKPIIKKGKLSIKTLRKFFMGHTEEYLTTVLTTLDEEHLTEALLPAKKKG